MIRLAIIAVVVALVAPVSENVRTLGAQPACDFTLGFATLRQMIIEQYGDVVGRCLENEYFNPENGNAQQQATGGLMVWRKADNWTAFTNGSITWLNGPFGLATRPNDGPLFPWEAPPGAPVPAAAPAPSAPAPASPAPIEPAPQSFSGKGKRVSDRFRLEQGLSIFRMKHSGRSNFIMELIDESGRTVELLVNEIGSFDGAKAIGVRTAGTYVIDIDADGNWSVTIEQPRPTSAPSTPSSFTGRGAKVTPFFALQSGLRIVSMQHNGRRNFIVELLDRNGKTVSLLANEIGRFDGQKTASGSGIHLLNIDADGDWTVRID
jgi:hypothetical protein